MLPDRQAEAYSTSHCPMLVLWEQLRRDPARLAELVFLADAWVRHQAHCAAAKP
jgi:hypothetical protein